ncbi:MAG TPA: nucleotide exchange factor GrpE [Bacillus sp. (in: firmicutes)]
MSVEKNSIQEEASVLSEEIHETEDIKKETEEQIEIDVETSGNPIEVELQDVKQQKVELEAKLEEAENRILRMQADFENSRRRARLDLEATEKYKSQGLITELLPAIDNFERALKMDADNDQAKSLLQGMEMVYRSLIDTLKKEGAEQIEAVGKEFDPHLHQAIMQVEDENFGSNIVVEEFQKGYILKDRVIRPAMVKVNQ